MKTFAITLQRAKERNNYIRKHLAERQLDCTFIDAVDGKLLTEKDIEACCDMEQIALHRTWLTKGAIGCALSHLKAYQEFLKTDDPVALVVEDDVVLPENIGSILKEIEIEIKPHEVILLYCTSIKPTKLSTAGKTDLKEGGLFYPMDISQTLTTTTYMIGREAARQMSNHVIPVRVAADSWHYYFNKECFYSFRVFYPTTIQVKNFKSSINYLDENSILSSISELVDKYKLPVIYQILRYRRKKYLRKTQRNFIFTDEVSSVFVKHNNL
jgi:glycosyl transferase, family 25